MYVKVVNEVIESFPYSVSKLRSDNPSTSFPKNISSEALAEWGVYPVSLAAKPSVQPDQVAERESQPVSVNGAWILGWSVRSATQEETDARAMTIRELRNQKLSDCDWTQLADCPLDESAKASWSVYRQSLRDITNQSGFPHSVNWPQMP